MRVLLVNPAIPPHNMVRDYAAGSGAAPALREKDGPPLGLNELAGALPEADVEILDLRAMVDKGLTGDPDEALAKTLNRFEPDVVGATCMAAQVRGALRALELAKDRDPDVLTVIGGLHPTSRPEDVNVPHVDLIALGLGKQAFRRVVEARCRHGAAADYSGIHGLARPEDGNLRFTPSLAGLSSDQLFREHYCDRPFPDRRLTDAYQYRIGPTGPLLHYLNTSIGCPHRCNYCSLASFYDGRYLRREVGSILEELETMDRYPVIRFCDANTFGDRRFAQRLFRAIGEADLDHAYVVDGRADSVVQQPEVWRAAAEAGLKVVIMGLDATTDEELAAYNKKSTIDATRRAIDLLHDMGVWISGNYIVRCDYDERQFEHTARFVESHPIFFSGFTILTPFPGTGQYELLKDQIVVEDLDYYNLTYPVLQTKLPEAAFHRELNELYAVGLRSSRQFRATHGGLPSGEGERAHG